MSEIAPFTAWRMTKLTTEVIIAERNEPDLKATIANIREHSPGVSVRVVSDKQGRGPMAMRHEGIMRSTADVVIIMDGHMRVLPRRLNAAAEYIGKRGKKVACLKCFHSPEVDWISHMKAGAKLLYKTYGGDGERDPPALAGKWRTEQSAGKIGCIMGACYVFRRDWYVDGLKMPWQHGTGWGCDEEMISAATWLRGGEVELLPWAVWHRARKPGQQPFRYTGEQMNGLFANRLRLLQVLPMPDAKRNELVEYAFGRLPRHERWQIAEICKQTEGWQAEYRAFLGAGGLSWDDFETMVIGKEVVKMPSMMELREQAREAGIKVPFGCKKSDLVRMLDDYDAGNKKCNPPCDECECVPEIENKPSQKVERPTTKPKQRANWGANEANNLGKRECPHCGAPSNSVVVNTRHVGRLTLRQRECKACAKYFPTREENEK